MSDKRLQARLIYDGTVADIEISEYFLSESVTTIGRSGDVKLPDEYVEYIGQGHDEVGANKEISTSREHAIITRNDDHFTLEDIGSKTGTYVNGVKLGSPQPEPSNVRFCHSRDYYSKREPGIRENNRGRVALKDGDIITLGQEIFEDKYRFIFKT